MTENCDSEEKRQKVIRDRRQSKRSGLQYTKVEERTGGDGQRDAELLLFE